MATKEGKQVDRKGDFHKCDYCTDEFECNDLKIDNDGFNRCDCLQLIVTDKTITRLAFWCSIDCMDEDFPQYSSSDDSDDDHHWEDFEEDIAPNPKI